MMPQSKTYAGFLTPSSVLLDSTLGLSEKKMALMGWRRTLQGPTQCATSRPRQDEELLHEIDKTLARLNRKDASRSN
ncbi:hypothetical protein [Roseibium limicola]|uniref:Uncharacterized protein n=1 Tax=Roseibium limicola TaxID=2816037 RepID=A0A939J8L9_9HYPH|nr:hypothetical protein [Roseibium limicola]MBO0347347.1 hypothetical protein [Roseibium limicola]